MIDIFKPDILTWYQKGSNIVNNLLEEIEGYKKELREYDLNEEIVKRDKRIKELEESTYFIIPKDKQDEISDWCMKHKHKGDFIYEFAPTGLGIVGVIKCARCGDEWVFASL